MTTCLDNKLSESMNYLHTNILKAEFAERGRHTIQNYNNKRDAVTRSTRHVQMWIIHEIIMTTTGNIKTLYSAVSNERFQGLV